MNIEMAYLLGMITGNGTIQRGNSETTVSIDIPHKKLKTEFNNDISLYVKASITDIRDILEPLIGSSLRYDAAKKSTVLSFTRKNEEYLMREILNFMKNQISHETMRIPDEVFSFTTDEKKSFIRGFGDVTAYIRKTNSFIDDFAHRVYVEIPHNWNLVVDYCKLLKSLDIPVQNIDWAHPNMRDPKCEKYNNGHPDFWKKEHQVKIWCVIYEQIGFNVIHKQNALEIYALEHKAALESKGKSLDSLYRFYWETSTQVKPKTPHPGENDSFLPAEIIGKHYDSWKDIANDLGYKSND